MNGYIQTIGRKLLIGLAPPKFPTDWNDPEQLQTYREKRNEWCHVVSLAIAGMSCVIFIILGALFDWWPDSWEWNSVAWSQDIRQVHIDRDIKQKDVEKRVEKLEVGYIEITKEQRAARATQLSWQIFNARKEQCELMVAKSNPRVWTDQLKKLEAEYQSLMNGAKFDTPSCPELGLYP